MAEGTQPPASRRLARSEPTILLIDDDEAVRESLALLLRTHGYEVMTAPDGRRGLDEFRRLAPSVVITDILMPEEDGIGAIREMRRLKPDAKIVAISGGGKVDKADYLTVAEQLGADAAIEKVDLGKLIEILPRLLAR
ncbi:MAG: response regulator [Stellaceae bacterium]